MEMADISDYYFLSFWSKAYYRKFTLHEINAKFEIRVNLSGINFLSPVLATGKGVETHDISDNECKGFTGVSRHRETEVSG